MTFVVTDNCQRCRFTDCVEVCPVDCFHADAEMLYIDPEECIDCGACVPECPVEAIFDEVDLPAQFKHWLKGNAEKSAATPVLSKREEPLPTALDRAKELGFNIKR
jgi:ferredoxin